jgi:hypothetical protein
MKEMNEYKTQGIEDFKDHALVCYVTRQNNIVVSIDSDCPDGGAIILMDCEKAEDFIANLKACIEEARLSNSIGKKYFQE